MRRLEPHHFHHHHFNEFATIAGNPSMSSFGPAGGHDPFIVEMSNSSWRGFATENNPAAPVGGWQGESSSFRPLHTNNLQNLSLSLCNPPQSSSFQPSSSYQPFHVKSSKYLLSAQELLREFCSLGEGSTMARKNSKLQDESTSSLNQQSLFSMEPLELQKRKAKLLSMLEEVDRRYRRYCEQMKAVVSTFEEVAGDGTARTYSMLASKAMSRHFRCLRDGIAGQIKETRRAMGENDAAGAATPGITRGETPRLKLLDQCIRQQKAFQQAGMMESHPWRPQRGLPERSVSILRSWLFEHFLHPYPSDVDKHILARQTGLSRSQVSNWFINARVRLWKPMVEEMYLEELKEEDKKKNQTPQATSIPEGGRGQTVANPNPSFSQQHFEDQKPEPSHHHHIDHDPHSLSSIITINMHSHHHNPNPNQNFGIIDGDFAAYRGHELTLGLQQHERPLLFSRHQIGAADDGGSAVQFSMIEEGGQNIPYRNLMGAQLLHDLAG